jgi:hypothetical protein
VAYGGKMPKFLRQGLLGFALMAVAGFAPLRAAVVYDYVDTTFGDHISFSLPSLLSSDSLPASSLAIATSSHGTITEFSFNLLPGGFCLSQVLASPCTEVDFGPESESAAISLISSNGNVLTYQGIFAPDVVLTVTSPSTVPEPATWGMLAAGIGLMLIMPWRRRNCRLGQ